MADGNAPKRIFIRKVLYRLDYQFITEKVQENIYQYISDQYGRYFDHNGCEKENAIDIEINTRIQDVFYFTKAKKEKSDGRTFLYFDIDLGIDNEQLPYYQWFENIIIELYKESKNMFRPMRIGLKKFNRFYVLDENLNAIKNIFQQPFVNNIDVTGFELDNFENQQMYTAEEYSINFIRYFSTGILSNDVYTNENAHLVGFDFDVFSDDKTVLEAFCKNVAVGLDTMNSIIYSFFTKVIRPEVVDRINNGDLLEDDGIIAF